MADDFISALSRIKACKKGDLSALHKPLLLLLVLSDILSSRAENLFVFNDYELRLP